MDSRIDAAVANSGKIIVGRLLPGTDVMTGLEDACKEKGVKSAYLAMGMGLLECSKYYVPERNESNTKIGVTYGEPNFLLEPLEILCMQGTICHDTDGYASHIHCTGVKLDGEVVGGHLSKGDNIVMATIDFVLCETGGVDLVRTYDDETGFIMLKPVQK